MVGCRSDRGDRGVGGENLRDNKDDTCYTGQLYNKRTRLKSSKR